MKLTIAALKKQGAFVGVPVRRTVKWKMKGKEYEADVYIRKFSYHSAVGELESLIKGTASVAGRIAGCVCDEKGKPIFTPDIVAGTGEYSSQGPLCDDLTMALLTLIGDVNKLGEGKPGNSQKPKNSGTNSSSTESAEKQ